MAEIITDNQRLLPLANESISSQSLTEETEKDIINQFLMIPKCSILKYGIKSSKEKIPYGFCSTCDINLIHPICNECLEKCHKNHLIKDCGKGNIICGCGERLHKFDSRRQRNEDLKFSLCPYYDWNQLSNISTVYLVGTKTVCLFCYALCEVEGGFPFTPDKKMESSCQCEEIQGGQTHQDLKAIYHKMHVLASESSMLMKELGPIKLLNLLFLGKVSYGLLFSNFEEMLIDFNKLKSLNEYEIQNNFIDTNFFLSLTIFTGIAQKIKNTPLRYFSDELCDKISFSFIAKVIKCTKYKENQAFWSFLNNLLFIFKKIVIGNETKTMDKFKLYDFENLSFIQRICLFHTNKSKIFTDAKQQITFFIDIFSFYLNSVITLVDGYDIIIQICGILKRMSGFYLFSSKEMIQFCLQFEKCFDFIKKFPNFNKQLQLFYIVIKMFHWFVYQYNDEVLYYYLCQHELLKEDDIKAHFIFSKNELGRLISRSVIRMMFFCTENIDKEVNYDQKKIIQKILQHGITILSFLIGSKDSYLMSLHKITKHCPEYLELIKVSAHTNPTYDKIQNAQRAMEENYQEYYTFKLNQTDLINNIGGIIDNVVNSFSINDIRPFVLKSNFYFSVIKICYIFQFSYENTQHEELIGKIFNFINFFIANSSDNALLVLSHYYLVGLMKLPHQYAKTNFTLFHLCCELISGDDSVLIYPKEILRDLCVYLITLKENYQEQNEEMNSLLALYLAIIQLIALNTQSLNEDVTKTVIKQIIIKLLNEFKLKSLDTNNIATFLQLANAIFDSSNCYDREILQNIFSIDYLLGELDNLSIKLKYRIEILRFVKKNKFDIYFEEDEIEEDDSNLTSNNISENSNTLLFEKSNDYLNAFVSNEDNFEYIRNSPLVANYQYPSKYFTFFYDIIKMNRKKDGTPVSSTAKNTVAFEREAFDLYIKELKRVKSLFTIHINESHVFVEYLAKGIFIPLISIVKRALCVTHLCNGKQILQLYNMALSILYIKKWLFTLDVEFKSAVESIEISHFNVSLLISEDHKAKCISDYDDLNEKIKYSPFDYTHLYTIFNRHLFSFVTYPKSLQLSEVFVANSNSQIHNDKSLNNKSNLMSVQTAVINPRIVERNIRTLFNSYNKMKNEINAENSSLFISLSEICIEYEKNFRSLLISLAICLSLESEQYESDCYIILFNLLSIQTAETQNDVITYLGGKSSIDLNFLLDFSDKLYETIVKIFINDFSGETQFDESLQLISFNLIKLFKYLCEEHNNFFQSRILSKLEYEYHQWNSIELIEDEEFQRITSMTFFNFLLNVIIKILLITDKAKDEAHMGFLFDLYFSIVELLIEIVQGNKEEILSTSSNKTKKEMMKNEQSLSTFKDFAQVASEIIFDDCLINAYSFKVKLQLMSFFIAILEEKTNDSLQKIIMKFLTLNKVLDSILFTLKTYFHDNTKNQSTFVKYYSAYSDKQIYGKEFRFDYVVFKFFKMNYFHSEFSKRSEEFLLANNYYRYIKILSINGKSPEASNLIKQVEAISESESVKRFMHYDTKQIIKPNEIVPINLTNEKEKTINMEFIEHYYVIKFFELITQVVEIYIQDEKRNQFVIFTMPSEMIYLSEMTKVEFLNNVDRESETSKKSELLKSISLFQKEIKYFKKTNLNWFIRFVIRLDYVYVQMSVYLYAVAFNILMVLTLKGYTQKEELPALRSLYAIDDKIQNAIDLSISEWGVILDTLTYILVILIGFLIMSWIAIKMPLYYRLDKIKYIKENNLQSKKQLTLLNKVYIALVMSIFDRDYINTLIYMFIVALVGAIMDRGEIVYPFLLIAIVNLNPTLKSIIKAIQMRYMELISVFLLMLIMIYFYSNIGFFFFNKNFERVIEERDDNLCKSLVFCFLTLVDAGIRARGGAGDQMIRISYEKNMVNYVERLFYDVTYFLIVIILMIDLVFGIIIGTFSEMRNEEIKYQIDKENHCFICHVTRDTIEQQRQDFTHHREVTHNLWSYVNYMIFLKFSNVQDLNAFNSYAKEHLEKNNICFLPSAITSYFRDRVIREGKEETNEEVEDSDSDFVSYLERHDKVEDVKQQILIQDLKGNANVVNNNTANNTNSNNKLGQSNNKNKVVKR